MHVLDAIANRRSSDVVARKWAEALRTADGGPERKHVFAEIKTAFAAVRQRTRMVQAAWAALGVLVIAIVGVWCQVPTCVEGHDGFLS
jgi:hypothetical protein